jgi:DNA-binding response OmpR family regulator
MLPGGNGIDLLRNIRATSDVPVIMLTAKSNDTERVIGLELGADDYVAKPYFPPELVARLRAVLRRPARRAASGDHLRLGVLTLDAARRWAGWDGVPLELTATEFNLLEILLRSGRGCRPRMNCHCACWGGVANPMTVRSMSISRTCGKSWSGSVTNACALQPCAGSDGGWSWRREGASVLEDFHRLLSGVFRAIGRFVGAVHRS